MCRLNFEVSQVLAVSRNLTEEQASGIAERISDNKQLANNELKFYKSIKGLFNLIAETEQKAIVQLGRPILLTDDRTLSQVNLVFRTLGTLADYIHLRLCGQNDG